MYRFKKHSFSFLSLYNPNVELLSVNYNKLSEKYDLKFMIKSYEVDNFKSHASVLSDHLDIDLPISKFDKSEHF
jgi:hypothetical protein